MTRSLEQQLADVSAGRDAAILEARRLRAVLERIEGYRSLSSARHTLMELRAIAREALEESP